jgi:hypothetical protein
MSKNVNLPFFVCALILDDRNLHFSVVNYGLAAELVQVNIRLVALDQSSEIAQLGLACQWRKIERDRFFLKLSDLKV